MKTKEDYIFIKSGGKIYKIIYEELLYAGATGNVTKIVTNSFIISTYISFTEFHEMLPNSIL